jgi:cytochrome c-type biogenesis protein CcmH/NrfG
VLLYELGQLVSSLDLRFAPKAGEFFQAAIQENPRNSSAWAYLGRVQAQLGRKKESEAAFARAIEIGTPDGDVYFLLGRAILDRANSETTVPLAEVLKARSMFAKATELRPDSQHAWLALGITYLHGDDDPAPGMAAAKRAIALAPADALASRTLQLLRERQHVRDINSAIESANRGQFAEAVAKLDRLIPTITNPQILRDARKLREDMVKQVKP